MSRVDAVACRVQGSNRLGGPLLGVSHQSDEIHPGVKQAYRVGYWGSENESGEVHVSRRNS